MYAVAYSAACGRVERDIVPAFKAQVMLLLDAVSGPTALHTTALLSLRLALLL
jgi:hypothetical protein